jgi:uncharacterized protein YndB with AHSA1/START domain
VIPKSAARAVADLTGGIILASVEIGVPPERVFAALTTAEVIEWWGSADTYRVTTWTADLKRGGAWRSSGVGADGKPLSVGGRTLEVEPPRLLVQTWEPDWDPGPATIVRYEVDAIPGGSRLTVRHEGFVGRAASCENHTSGWEGVLGWLQRHLSGGSSEVAGLRA